MGGEAQTPKSWMEIVWRQLISLHIKGTQSKKMHTGKPRSKTTCPPQFFFFALSAPFFTISTSTCLAITRLPLFVLLNLVGVGCVLLVLGER